MTLARTKAEYRPSLEELLAPRWRVASGAVRALVVCAVLAVLVLVALGARRLIGSHYSHSGTVSFGFSYRGFQRAAPEQGQYVRLIRGREGGAQDSYAVAPIRLPSYSGSASGELPLFATGYADALARRFPSFRLEGEGKTRISSTLSGYQILFSTLIGGHRLSGRDVLLLPERAGVRAGVAIEMLTSDPATVSKPVASSGPLERPLKTFSFG